MPVDDTLDTGLSALNTNLDELDKKATKAVKTLEKERRELEKARKELEKKGGAFTSDDAKQQQKEGKKKQSFESFQPEGEEGLVPLTGGNIGAPIEGKGNFFDELQKNVDKKIKVGFREALADQAGGTKGVNFLFSMGKNPVGTAKGLMRAIPFIGGIVAAAEFGQAIFAELEKLDDFFKKFIAIIDTRHNQLRKIDEQAHIRAGDTQLIITTESGGANPRESYNTFNEFNTNRTILENDFAVRDTSGV